MVKKIKTVTIIGANGTLGTAVTAIFASFGDAKVYMISRTREKSENAICNACNSVKADAIKENMIPKAYDDLEECLRDSDLVLECIIEEIEAKKKIHTEINQLGKKDCIYASVTSGISINDLSSCYDDEKAKKFMGIHFFNPPYQLQLCELIPSKITQPEILKLVKEYLESLLERKVIVTKDKAGFLANRIGFQFINKALQYAEKYSNLGGIDYIDTILGCFTGRNMPPLLTADFVGLDIHKAIVENIYQNTEDYERETFLLPNFVQELIKCNVLGRKTKMGLYKKDEEGNQLVYDIQDKNYRKIRNYEFSFITKMIEQFKIGNYFTGIEILKNDPSQEANICMEFLKEYIHYSLYVAKEIGEKIEDCDIAMAEGFNWIPPIALQEILGEKSEIEMKSNYDYRKFLKAKR